MSVATLEQTAETLAKAHAEAEEDTIEIYLSPDEKVIRFIEVAETVGTTNELLPFRFDPKPEKGIAYPLSIIMASEEEMRSVFDGTLELPEGWGPPDRLRLIFRKGA